MLYDVEMDNMAQTAKALMESVSHVQPLNTENRGIKITKKRQPHSLLPYVSTLFKSTYFIANLTLNMIKGKECIHVTRGSYTVLQNE
jgi:hypothetical protein